MHQENWTHPFEIPVNDTEAMNVYHTGHDLRELRMVDEREGTRGIQQTSSQVANGSPLGWILRTASHSHLASTR